MTFKPTPGPWCFALELDEGFPVTAEITTESGEIIASLTPGGGSVDRNTADVCLMAAAPDLLAACEAALSYLDGRVGNQGRVVYEELAAAIAKARWKEADRG